MHPAISHKISELQCHYHAGISAVLIGVAYLFQIPCNSNLMLDGHAAVPAVEAKHDWHAAPSAALLGPPATAAPAALRKPRLQLPVPAPVLPVKHRPQTAAWLLCELPQQLLRMLLMFWLGGLPGQLLFPGEQCAGWKAAAAWLHVAP